MVEKRASLTVLGGPLGGVHCLLPHSGTVTIGSAPGSTLRLDTPGVSPYHARVVVKEGRITVHETGAEHHLHVNDDPIDLEGSALNNGDILWLGAPGGEDVVMLQCSVPSTAEERPAAATHARGAPIAPTPDVETQALWATEPEHPPATPHVGAGPVPGAVTGFEETVALDLELGIGGGFEPPAAWVEEGIAAAEAGKAAEPLGVLPEDAGTEGPLGMLPESPDTEETLVIAPEGAGTEDQLVMAPGWEGEVGTEEAAPQPTAIYFTAPDDEIVEAALAPPEPQPPALSAPPLPPPVSPPPVAPRQASAPPIASPPVSPSPPPAASPAFTPPDFSGQVPRSPSASHGPTPRPPSPSHSHPSASQPPRRRDPTLAPRPDASHAMRPPPQSLEAEPEVLGDEPEPTGGGIPRSAVLAVAGFAGVLVVAGLGWAVWRFLSPGPAPTAPRPSGTPALAAARLPSPATPAPTPVPSEPESTATPPLAAPLPTPQAALPTPTPVPTPTPRATPTPSAAPRSIPTPAASAPPAEAQRAPQTAAQAQALVGEAETALGARQYDVAVSRLDEALRLEPANARATALRADAVRRRDLARRRFVPGRTAVLTQKAQKEDGSLAGFDTGDADLRKAPDFQGRVEFEMSPASGLEPGDAWTLRVFVVNEGKKPIRVQGLTVGTAVNGTTTSGSAAPRSRDIAPQQRALVGEVTGSWREGTTSWATDVAITANKGDSLKNTIAWR